MTFSISMIRGKSTLEGTPGKLTTSAGFTCDTLELPWENNKSDISCIIADSYNAQLFMSPHFGHYVVRLEDKHGRKNVEIHNANFAGEAPGDIKQLDGCTAVGNGYGQIAKPAGGTQFGITASVATVSNLIQHIIGQVGEKGTFVVTYSWGDGCAPDDSTDLNGA